MLGHLFRVPTSDFRVSQARALLSRKFFARRLERARGELKARGLDLLSDAQHQLRVPHGYNPGRSERLIALLLPVAGAPAIVCPSFEIERIKRHSVVTDLHGWEEQEDPTPWCARRSPLRPGSGRGAIASVSTAYQTFGRLGAALPGWKFVDRRAGDGASARHQVARKVGLLRRAIAIPWTPWLRPLPSSRSAHEVLVAKPVAGNGAARRAGWRVGCSSARPARCPRRPRGPKLERESGRP